MSDATPYRVVTISAFSSITKPEVDGVLKHRILGERKSEQRPDMAALLVWRDLRAAQRHGGRLSTAENIVTLSSGSVVMTLASAHSVAMVGIPHLGHVPIGALRQEDVPKI